MDFLLFYSQVVIELSNVLEKRFISGGHVARTRLGQIVESVVVYNNQGDYEARDMEIIKLAFLTKHLKEIKQYDLALFRQFRKHLLKIRKVADFYGLRQEINIAASLIRKHVPFDKTDPPDFSIEYDGNSIAIECGSTHISKEKTGSLIYKIQSEVRGKVSKPYANPNTALFMDITNVFFNSLPDDEIANSSRLAARVRSILPDNSFGNVTLFFYIFDVEQNQIQSNYKRIDNENIDTALRDFLDKHFPKGDYELQQYIAVNTG